MVIGGVSREWSIRLARLQHLVETGASGPAWLWRIRIRILGYLLARYGEPPALASPPEPRETADEARVPPEPAPPVSMGYRLPPVAVEHPPKAAPVISPVLDEIHELNARLRAARWEAPTAEQVWGWWRAAWCRRP
jgi:hypothetical protein